MNVQHPAANGNPDQQSARSGKTCGTRQRYKRYGCRCPACVAANYEYQRRYRKERRSRHKAKAFEYLGGPNCWACGSSEDLEFDHVNPNERKFTIGSKLSTASWKRLEQELDKCQLLCRDCHMEKSVMEGSIHPGAFGSPREQVV